MVSELDAGVGDIVDALEREGIREETLLFFLSDNGGLNPGAVSPNLRGWAERLQAWFGAPLPIPILEFMRKNSLEGGADNRPFRRGKATVSEGGVRVPGLVSWPGTLSARQLDSVVTVEDILPTLADLLDFAAATGAPFDGVSQWSSLQGSGISARPDFLIHGLTGEEAWYEYPWKLVLPADGPYQLYQLEEDPIEAIDLAAARPDRVQRMRAAHSAFPRGRSIAIPFYEFILDPDNFGGAEDREPWADVVKQ
jgi:arylsulfatase A-like enzyme